MAAIETLARHGPALRSGGESLWRWVSENETRAAAVGAYAAAVVAMLVIVISAGPDRASAPASAARLRPDVPAYYSVRKKDTLAAVADRFGLSLAHLRALNPKLDPLALRPGAKIRLRASAPPVARRLDPGRKTAGRVAKDRGASAASEGLRPPGADAGPERAARESETYRVQPGDTLYAIAARFGTTVDELVALNPGIDASVLLSGQEVRIR